MRLDTLMGGGAGEAVLGDGVNPFIPKTQRLSHTSTDLPSPII